MIAKELKKVQSNLRKIIECSICTSVLNDPVRTPCNHKFCRDCINRVVIKKSAGDCPLCNHVLSKRSLKSSNRLTAVINSTKLLIDALNEDNNLEEIKESATSHENLLEDSVNNAVTLRNSLRCSTPIKGNAFGKRNCDKVSKKFKRDLPLVSELDQENLQISNLINPDSLDPIQSTKRRKTTVLDDSTTVLDYLARDDLIGGGKKSPELISTKNSDIALHSSKNQPSNRLITALNRQQNVLIEPDEDGDPYQFIPSQTLFKNLKRSGRKLKKTAAKVESKQPRRRTLPKKKKDIFESLRNSSVSSEEEVNEDVHALFLTPQPRLKDYSRVPKRKSQNKKAEIPMSFSLFRRRNSSVSQRSQWRKQQIESKTPNPTNTKKKQQLKRRSERISSRKKPDRTNDISPSNTNENLKFSENTSEAEEPSSKKRVSEIRFNRSRSEVTEKEGRTSTLHDGIFISEQVNILNKTKPLSIVIENMKNNFVSVSKNLLSSKSSTDALESKSINPNKNDNEGIFSTNENLETCSITNKELENECVETRLVDREISVDEGVNLTDEDIFKPSDKFDEVSAGNNFSNILLCPTQVYVDSSEEETENNPSDSKKKNWT